MATWVKFCGCTSLDDVALAAQTGADAFGMIFAPSPRRIAWEAAEAIARRINTSAIEPVAVVVDPTNEELSAVRALFPTALIQFSGNESADFVASCGARAMKAIHVGDDANPASVARACWPFARARILFDTKAGSAGGSGVSFPWATVAGISGEREVVIAGGLTPENVGACVAQLAPFGVDVRSGIETGGRKDVEKMRAFVRAVREAECVRA